jgi:hypothetical protein
VGNKSSEESGFGEKNMLIHTLIKAVKDETLTKMMKGTADTEVAV